MNQINPVTGEKEGLWEEYGLLSRSVGYFVNGLKEGIWKNYSNNHLQVELEYIHGEDTGFRRYYHSNGRLKGEGYLIHVVKEGFWKHYHNNGLMEMQGNFIHGREDGLWRIYGPTGSLIRIIFMTPDRSYHFNI